MYKQFVLFFLAVPIFGQNLSVAQKTEAQASFMNGLQLGNKLLFVPIISNRPQDALIEISPHAEVQTITGRDKIGATTRFRMPKGITFAVEKLFGKPGGDLIVAISKRF